MYLLKKAANDGNDIEEHASLGDGMGVIVEGDSIRSESNSWIMQCSKTRSSLGKAKNIGEGYS
jgi:hypothetical protein